ncbi:MAG: ABC transporter permease [Actinocatenispora sp.]
MTTTGTRLPLPAKPHTHRRSARRSIQGSLVRAVSLGLARGRLETLQFFRTREAVMFSLLFPAFMMIVLVTLFGSNISPDVEYSQYLVPGIIASGLITGGFQTLVIQIPIERDRGGLKRLAATPMPKSAYFIGKTIMVIVTSVIQLVILLVVSKLAFDVKLPATLGDWETFAWVYLLGITACTLCGVAMSSIPRNGKTAPIVMAPISLILQFISGVFTTQSHVPKWIQYVADVFPLKWMCQGMRSTFLPDSFAKAETGGGWQLGWVAAVTGAWVVLGLLLCLRSFRWTKSRDGG